MQQEHTAVRTFIQQEPDGELLVALCMDGAPLAEDEDGNPALGIALTPQMALRLSAVLAALCQRIERMYLT